MDTRHTDVLEELARVTDALVGLASTLASLDCEILHASAHVWLTSTATYPVERDREVQYHHTDLHEQRITLLGRIRVLELNRDFLHRLLDQGVTTWPKSPNT